MAAAATSSAIPRARPPFAARSVIPGFGLTFGLTITWLSMIVLIPLSAVFIRTASLGWDEFVAVALSARAIAAYKLSFGAAALAAFVNAVFGLIVAWSLVRYQFPGKRIVSALVDLPFALPTAVASMTGGTWSWAATRRTAHWPRTMPRTPPMRHMTTLSSMNWLRMVLRFAPMALRRPISLVRS